MTYETLLYNLKLVYTYFYGMFASFLAHISQYPVIVLSLIILIALPALYLVFSFVSSLSDSSDDITTEGIRIYKYFKSDKFKKKSKEMRMNFHKTKKYFEQKKLNNTLRKMENVPLKIPERYQYLYSPAPKKVNPSSASTQRSSANIDVEYDED